MAEAKRSINSQNPPAKRPAVYFFGTCLIDTYYPEAGLNSIRLLEHTGFDVVFPQDQTCCGQPPYNSGFAEHCLPVAQQTIRLLSQPALPVVVPSASCAGMIKHQYPELFTAGTAEFQAAEALAGRTFEFWQFISEHLRVPQTSNLPEEHVSLHLSCSALREMQVGVHWQDILNSLPGVSWSLPERYEECCGFGGTFAVKSPDISAAMTADKAEALLADQPSRILSGDCGCLLNLGSFIRAKDGHDPCEPLASFVARRLGVKQNA